MPKKVEHRSLTALRENLVKIGKKMAGNDRHVTFRLAELAVPRSLFQRILSVIDDLQPRPAPAWAEEIHGDPNTKGEVCLGNEKTGRMGFRTRPNHQNRAVGWLRRGKYQWRRHFGTIAVDLKAIWEMSV